jgi:hypothetical protein
MPRRLGARPDVGYRTLAWITVDSAESNTNEFEPPAIERRAAARAECAYIRRRRFVLRNQLRTHDDTELVGPDGRVSRERGAGHAPAHRTMAINDRSKPAIDFIADVSAKTSPSDHSLFSPLDLRTNLNSGADQTVASGAFLHARLSAYVADTRSRAARRSLGKLSHSRFQVQTLSPELRQHPSGIQAGCGAGASSPTAAPLLRVA